MRSLRLILAVAAIAAAPLLAAAAANAQGAAKADNPAIRSAIPTLVQRLSAQTSLPQPTSQVVNRILSTASSSGQPGGLGGSSAAFNGSSVIRGGIDSPYTSQAYGTGAYPFTTKRVASWAAGPYLGVDSPVSAYPWRATGKLWMYFAASTGKAAGWYVCTASLIRKGLLVTAAHCIHNFGRGSSGWTSQVLWYPAEYKNGGPEAYGIFRAKWWAVPTPYFNGTDTCAAGASGVVCNNDLAVIVLWSNNSGAPNDSGYPAGAYTGYYSYGWNGYSFVTSPYLGNRYTAQITQLGYPVALDGGFKMIRTDSVMQYYGSGNLRNQIWGSAQTGGSSGGPEFVNFGTPPVHSSGSSAGSAPNQAVIGVTSWGYTDFNIKIQGGSWFGANAQYPANNYGGWGGGNIGFMVYFACLNFPAACN